MVNIIVFCLTEIFYFHTVKCIIFPLLFFFYLFMFYSCVPHSSIFVISDFICRPLIHVKFLIF